ncbi:MAG TPA: response regulator transcription factor [Gaiellaceae bacterium]
MADPIRVLIVDDHAVIREGLRAFLELQDRMEVIGEAGDGREAIEEAERLRPDVILMDLVMPRLDGVEAMRELHEQVPAARVIVLTSFLDDERLVPALRAGAAGYLLKNVEPQELARAIRLADAGEAMIDPAVAARLVDALVEVRGDEGPKLTRREQEVLELIGRGLANKRIALELGIAEKTVKTHVSHVLAKLGVSDRTQAALYVERSGRRS